MRTYFYIQSNSPVRGCNVRITVYRVKRNHPEWVGCQDHHTKAWRGERATACRIINEQDKLPMKSGYELRDLLPPAEMYDAISGNGIRLFCIGTY